MSENRYFFLVGAIALMFGLQALQASQSSSDKNKSICKDNLEFSSPSEQSLCGEEEKVNCDCLAYCKNPRDCVPDPMQQGPWGVGYQEFLIQLGHPSTAGTAATNLLYGVDYTFRAAVWFPVKKAAADKLPVTNYFISTSTQSAASGGDTYQAIPASFLSPVNQLNAVTSVPYPATIAVDGTNLKPAKKSFPLIVSIPGAGGGVMVGSNINEMRTSHGFVTISLFSVGTQPKESLFGISASPNATAFDLIQEQLESLLNWYLAQNSDPSSKFHKTADPNRIGASGYSRGGAFMQTFAVNDPRIKVLLGTSAGSGVAPFPPASDISLPFLDIHGTSDTNVSIYNTSSVNSPLVRFQISPPLFARKIFMPLLPVNTFHPPILARPWHGTQAS